MAAVEKAQVPTPRDVQVHALIMEEAWAKVCAMFPLLRKYEDIRPVRFGPVADERGYADLRGQWRYVFRVYDPTAPAAADGGAS